MSPLGGIGMLESETFKRAKIHDEASLHDYAPESSESNSPGPSTPVTIIMYSNRRPLVVAVAVSSKL